MNWQAFGASVQGISHRRMGLPCQDACKWQILPRGVICAVADGLGSAAKAEEGAKIVVETVVAMLAKVVPVSEDYPNDKTITDTLRAAVKATRITLEQQSVTHPLHDYATTLLVVWVTNDWSAVAHIGDGVIVGQWSDGRIEALSLPQQGEYANETIPITADDALSRLYVKSWQEPLLSIALLSDGLQNLAINLSQGTPYVPFFAPFFNATLNAIDSDSSITSKQLADFLDSERVCIRTDDDKTLVIARRCVIN